MERREARRSALWAGRSLPLEGQARSQDGPMGAAFRAREFRRSASLFWRAKGSKPTIWTEARRDAPRGNTPARVNTWMEEMRSKSKKRAACSHLILRSRAQRGVSKDGDALRCSTPFETPAVGGLLRVRPKSKGPFGGTNPRTVLAKRTREPFWRNEPERCAATFSRPQRACHAPRRRGIQ